MKRNKYSLWMYLFDEGKGHFLLRLVFGSPKIMHSVTWLPFWRHPKTGSLWQYWQPFRDCWGDPDRCGLRCSIVLHSHKPQQLLCIYKKYLVQKSFLNTATFGGKVSINWTVFLLMVVAYFSWNIYKWNIYKYIKCVLFRGLIN